MLIGISLLVFSIGLISAIHLALFAVYFRKPSKMGERFDKIESDIKKIESDIQKLYIGNGYKNRV